SGAASTTGSATPTSTGSWPSSGSGPPTCPRRWPGRWRRPRKRCGRSSSTSRRAWRRPSTGPSPWPPSGGRASTSARSRSHSGRCSSTGRTRSGCTPTVWPTSSGRPSCAVPETDARPAPEVERMAVAFGRVLRGAGVDVPIGRAVTFARALALVGVGRPAPVYWAGRTTLLARPEDIAAYDRAFDAFWRGRFGVELTRAQPVELTLVLDTHDEFEEARRLMTDLRLHGALRRSRRRRPSRKREGRPDLRRTVRRSLRSGGEPIRRAFTAAGERPRRIVLICDVSGSMEPYSRALLRFLHAAVVGRGRIEAFALGTRLTRITRELSSRDPDAALAKAARSVPDWSGGTRLGEALRAFNDQWGVRGMARGSVVVILSDGWDRGDPQLLAEQMQRLHRVAYRTVWV